MNHSQWRKIVGGAFLASALLLAVAAPTWAQATAPTAKVIVEAVAAEPGVLIVRVTPAGPAAQAGLKRGDIVLKVGDSPVNQAAELAEMIRAAQVDDKLALTVQRGDEEQKLTLTVGERRGTPYVGIVPDGLMMAGEQDVVGDWQAATPLAGGNVTVSQTVGIEVITVLPASPAAAAGLAVGDLIVAVDEQAFTPGVELSTLIQDHKPGDKVTLQLQGNSPDAPAKAITVTLGEHPDAAAQAYLGVKVAPRIFAQVDAIQSAPHGQGFLPAPGMRRFHFMQPFGYAAPPFMPMLPYGYWFGYPGYGMAGCSPATGGMPFMLPVPLLPVPPAMAEPPAEWLFAPEVEIRNFELAQPAAPGVAPDGLAEPLPNWQEEGPEL